MKRRLVLCAAVVLVLVACTDKPKDSDSDGLSDGEEIELGLKPDDADSDDDGVDDGAEDHDGTDPLSSDSDDDGATDKEEHDAGTDPTDPNDGGTGTDDRATDDAEDPADEGATDACTEAATSPCLDRFDEEATQTCHNFSDAGGASDGRVFGVLFGVGAPGTFVLSFAVEGAAPGSPTPRTAQAAYNAAGEFVARVPLFAPGEVLVLTGVDFGQGPVDPATLPGFTFTVLPLDDPATVCDPL